MEIKNEFNVGDEVFDDLTGTKAKIIGLSFYKGYTDGHLYREYMDCIGYWLDNNYLSGGRHPWEVSKIR